MIKIEQVRLLEQRVQKVISRIGELEHENSTLRGTLQTYQDRIADLELRIEGFTSNQEEIEAGILSALQHLDEVEDSLGEEGLEQRHVEVDTETGDPAPGDPATDDAIADDAIVDAETTEGYPDSTTRADEASSDEAPADEASSDETSSDEAPADDDSATAEDTDDEQAEESGPELDIF
jgi:hypothetical protein